jgi:hypothetical protein
MKKITFLLKKGPATHFACLFHVIYKSTFWIDRILIEVNGADFVTSDFVISDGF